MASDESLAIILACSPWQMLRYRRGTPLGDLRAEAWIERSEGIKTWARGHIADAEGVTVEAEGLFILPKWARERIAAEAATPTYFE